mgnify:CR=1 FL=1
MYDCQRRFLYLIIIIYLIIYISARVTYIGSHWGAGTCTDATMRARDARAAGRPAAARTRRAEGQSGANTAKNREAVWVFQILCLPLPDAEEAPAPANAISKSVEVPTAAIRQLCRRPGLCTMVAGTMRHGGRDYAPGRRDYAPGHWGYAPWSLGLCTMVAGTMHHGRWDYAPWRLGLCTRSQGARTKDKRYI